MNITLPSIEEFYINDVVIADTPCVLVHPRQLDVKWTEQNKWFRSSIWTKDELKPVSLGFRKFTNYGEQPDFEPLNLKSRMKYIRKVDGTCLIVSKFKGELITRTRGSVSTDTLANCKELEVLKQKYPAVFNNKLLNDEQTTLLFEWTTPSNIIVLRESEAPELRLIGATRHNDYTYYCQAYLDEWAKTWGVPRPESYEFNTFEEMEAAVKAFEGKEGVVIYGNMDQVLKKVKSLKYLQLHRIKDKLRSDDAVLDFYLTTPEEHKGNLEAFLSYVVAQTDFEIAKSVKPVVEKIFEARTLVTGDVMRMGWKVIQLTTDLPTRKEQAAEIMKAFKEEGNTDIAFALLDNKVLTDKQIRRLFKKALKC